MRLKILWQLYNLCRLGRVGMAPFTMSVPITGALTLGHSLLPMEIVGLGLLGLCAHLFGFATNDIIDRSIDCTVPSRQRYPLLTGELALWQAWLFALVQVPLALGIYHFFLAGTGLGLGLLSLSIGLSLVYNLWSKQGYLSKFLAELGLATSVGLLCLAGTFSPTVHLMSRNIVFAVTLALVLLLLNSVPSGLKDLKTDFAFGARNFAIVMGCRMIDSDQMFISKCIRIYSLILQMALLVCLVELIYLLQPPWFVIILAGVLWLYAGLHLRMVLTIRSFNLLHQASPILNGIYNYLALALFVVGWMPLFLQVGYGLLILTVLREPWTYSFRMWCRRYQLISKDSRVS